VNDHEKGAARALPARSFAPVVIVAVMTVGFGSPAVGVNWATRVVLLYVTIPGIAAPVLAARTVKVVVLMLAESIGSLNVINRVATADTPVALLGGFALLATTVGGVISTVVTVDWVVSAERSETIPPLQFAATE
jgi:hypothetical protein